MTLRLSHLQRSILYLLLKEWNYELKHQKLIERTQREFNTDLYNAFFHCDKDPSRLPSAKASLSRAYKRLEMQK